MERTILKCIRTIDDFKIDECRQYGVGVELQDFTEPNLSVDQINSIISAYKNLFKEYKCVKSMHGPFLDLKPASPDKDIRMVSYNKYKQALTIAKELNLDYIVFHSQINPYINDPIMTDLNNYMARQFWHEILMEIDYQGIVLLENIFEETPYMLKDLIDRIDLPNVKVNFDLGHARLGTVSMEKWFKVLRDDIAYIHLHSNDGVYDQHKMPTDVELLAMLNLLNKYNLNPVISLEYFPEKIGREIGILNDGART